MSGAHHNGAAAKSSSRGINPQRAGGEKRRAKYALLRRKRGVASWRRGMR